MDDRNPRAREVRLWSAFVGRGLIGAIAAMLFLSFPWMSPRTLAAILVAYAVGDAGVSLYGATQARRAGASSSALLAIAAIDAAAAVLALVLPAVTALRLIGGVRAIASGSCDAISLRGRSFSELLTLRGVIAIGLGILILVWPGPATLALPWLLGVEAMISGGLLFTGGASELKRAQQQQVLAPET
jgi:uncharacterized membrane protein HdeD (DUF308 family)